MRLATALVLLVSVAGAFLIANTRFGTVYVYETLPATIRPVNVLVDTEAVSGVTNPRGVTQALLDAWNAVPEALTVFGTASFGGPYNGSTAGQTFGVFTNSSREVAFDSDGQILTHYGVGPGVLGITLKAVDLASGRILDFLCVINVQPGALVSPGATVEELFRTTLSHELGHTLGLGHSPVGMTNANTFGLDLVPPTRIATMFPFRTPITPEEGASLEADDRAGLIRSYPGDTSGLGSISGRVRGLSGAPINEIAVRAIGPSGVGESHVGVITNEDGANQGMFRIPNLVPGAYRVLIETINGRNSVTGDAIKTGTNSLGSTPFVFAVDEFWQPGDTYGSGDDPAAFATVQVRAGDDSGSVHFVLNGRPIFLGETLNGALGNTDARVPTATGGFQYADYYLFQGSVGQSVALSATSGSIGPQLRLLRPSDMEQEDSDLPAFGGSASINTLLQQSGVYTVVLFARRPTGNPGGTGNYTLSLAGAGSGLPPAPTPAPATIAVGPNDPGDQQFANPVCSVALLQARIRAPTHEQLWVDRVVVRSSGSGDEAADVTRVALITDQNGDGVYQGGEPILGTGTFSANDGSVAIDVDLALAAGSVHDLLVVYDVTVMSVSSAGSPLLWFLPALLLLALLRPRRIRVGLLLLLVFVPLACGGGGGTTCNQPFNAAGAIATFQPRLDAGDITAFTVTGGGVPFDLVTATLQSGTLSVSN